jgi:hypothetical protein
LKEKIDAIFNLFSFGYFENDEDNLTTLSHQRKLVRIWFCRIDFMNVPQVLETLVPEETKTVDEIDFHITTV